MAQTFEIITTGDKEIDRFLNVLPKKKFVRKAVVRPAREGLKIIVKTIKAGSRRTHPLSKLRDPVGSSVGPMARFVGVRAIRARSKTIGAKTIYNMKKFPRFAVTSKAGKRAFYPSAQEYGAKRAKPPIKPKRQNANAIKKSGANAVNRFKEVFRANYPQVVEEARNA